MMLRKSPTTTSTSTTPIASKQATAKMADYKTLLPISPSYTYNKSPSSSSFFNSPRNFTSKGSNDSESFLISPTSILDTKSSSSAFSSFYPFSSSSDDDSKGVQMEKLDDSTTKGGVGLGILDALVLDTKKSKTKSPAVLFCSKLKIEIPSSSSSSIVPFINEDDSLQLKSPSDFGIKTRNSAVVGLLEKSNSQQQQQRVLSGLSITEMENSEEYTCVVSHGPNPKTTHIFDDCVIESCYYGGETGTGTGVSSSSVNVKESFISFCYNCKKNLNQGNDIYIYRGEKAFCSSDCRYKEMNKDNLSFY